MEKKALKIGFVGQGYVGKNYADDFEDRGYEVVRYSLEEPYIKNKDQIKDCDFVFIAVPTPTTSEGFDGSIVTEALSLVGEGKVAVIKSTMPPGLTNELQEAFPSTIVIFSPEFLREATAAHDAAHPYSIIIGSTKDDDAHKKAAETLLSLLPESPSVVMCTSNEAEFVKFIQNCIGYIDIVAFNLFYDLASEYGVSWEQVNKGLKADPDIPSRFANPIHKSGRGAGGHCLIKDFAAFRELYKKLRPDDASALDVLYAVEKKNVSYLRETGKDKDLVDGVYGAGGEPQK